MEAKCGHDSVYLAKVFPIAREVLTSHPDFEWTVASKLGRMIYVLNEEEARPIMKRNNEWREALSDFPQELGLARLVPGDAAFRLLGPCLFSPYYPELNHGDATQSSPAAAARGTLAQLLKERRGEELPKDIEAARAWWKANEQRFAEKESPAPKTHAASPDASQSEAAHPRDSQREDGPSRSTDSRSVSNGAPSRMSWTATIGVLAALLFATVLFLFKRR